MVHGPARGLELLKTIEDDPRLGQHSRLEAVRAYLLERSGDREGAIRNYRAAAGKTGNLPERNYLLAQAARLSTEGLRDQEPRGRE
jgi:predicted RNA polymerase sigma factor